MSTPTSVVIHPLVLLSVVDHYDRVAREANKRAVGVLLGESFKGRVDVTNSFAVPFEEDPKDPRVWFLDHSYLEEMFLMFRKVNMKEKIVGWYSTGPKICNSDLELNEVMRRYTAEPVFTVVDVNPPDDVEIPTTSYLSVEENLKNAKSASATRRTFVHLPTEVGAFEAEEVGVETLLRDIRDNTTSTLTDQVRSRFSALKALHKRMGSIREYLEHVAAGRLPVNHEILYNLQDMFNLSPNLTQEELVSAFQVKTNDHLHVTFMASMVRSVLALHNLIDNKQMNLRVEAESRAKEIAAQQKKDEREKPSKEVPGDPRAGDMKDETDAREGH